MILEILISLLFKSLKEELLLSFNKDSFELLTYYFAWGQFDYNIANNNFPMQSKKIVITGHTGFKGSWLTLWLTYLGANIVGISKDVPTYPSNFSANHLKKKINHHILDIRDKQKLEKIIKRYKPDYIFHLAAQSLVKRSYRKPMYTFETNSFGTLNLLEILKNYNNRKICSIVIITSDKSYRNLEHV